MANPKLTLSTLRDATENATTGLFSVGLDSPAPAGGLTVYYNTTGSSATLDTDYSLLAGTNITNITANSFTIAAGATSATLQANALADNVADSNETVNLHLVSGQGYQLANTTGTFADKVDYAVGHNPQAIDVGDFNGDGKLDLAVTNGDDNTCSSSNLT